MKKITVKKPWGLFIQVTHNQKSTVKILEVNPDEMLSLQSHKKEMNFGIFLKELLRLSLIIA